MGNPGLADDAGYVDSEGCLADGDGANGKSTYLRAVLAFLGRQNVAPSVFTGWRTTGSQSRALSAGSRTSAPTCPARISPAPQSSRQSPAATLMAERKFEESFEFVPFARLIFSANHPPKSQDASSAFFRRWVVVPFERTFHAGDPARFPATSWMRCWPIPPNSAAC